MISIVLGQNKGCALLGKTTPQAQDILRAVQGLDQCNIPEFESMAVVGKSTSSKHGRIASKVGWSRL